MVSLSLAEDEVQALLDWTEGEPEAEPCGDENCAVCRARTKLEAAVLDKVKA